MAVYVDDTLASGNENFEKVADHIPKTFESKKKEYPPFFFAGININKATDHYFLEQESYTKGLTKQEKTASFDDFRTTRHKTYVLS